MRGAFVGIVGATVIALSILGLVEHEQRAGPWDVPLQASAVPFTVEGTFHARAANDPVFGFCLEEPCQPHTSIELSFEGLPPMEFTARLARLGGDGGLDLGALQADGQRLVLRWQESADHTDKQRLVLGLAGRDVASVPLVAGSAQRIDATLSASWPVAPATLHLNEIGGVTVSTVAKARLPQVPPAGWTYHAHLEGEGQTDLGALEVADGSAVLDARIERLALEAQDRLVITLRSEGAAAGFPVLVAAMPAK